MIYAVPLPVFAHFRKQHSLIQKMVTEIANGTLRADILEECDRLIQLINTTLDVAETEAGLGDTPKKTLNISILAEDACELFHPVAEQKSIQLACDIQPERWVEGQEDKLQRMLANLIDNALKYTPEGGRVSLQLRESPQGIVISISRHWHRHSK